MNDELDHNVDTRLIDLLGEKYPEGFPTQVVLTASYIDPEGETRWSAHTWGNGSTASAVGLLEYAKAWLIEDMLGCQEDDA